MAEVTRRSGSANRAEGFVVETTSPDGERTYIFEAVETDDEDEQAVECVERRYFDPDTGDVEQEDPEATESVEDALAEYGYDVVDTGD